MVVNFPNLMTMRHILPSKSMTEKSSTNRRQPVTILWTGCGSVSWKRFRDLLNSVEFGDKFAEKTRLIVKPKTKGNKQMIPIILVRCIIGAVIGWTIGRILTYTWETHQA